jgi:hypothetical protein
LVGGLGTGLIGGLAVLVAAGFAQADDLGEAIGNIILFVLFVLLAIMLGIWIGATVGINYLLKLRDLPGPRSTAIPFAVIVPFWAIAVIFLASRLPDLGLAGPVAFLLVLIAIALIIIPPALMARAIFRFRTTGGL